MNSYNITLLLYTINWLVYNKRIIDCPIKKPTKLLDDLHPLTQWVVLFEISHAFYSRLFNYHKGQLISFSAIVLNNNPRALLNS